MQCAVPAPECWAKISFVVGATLLLMSEVQWWYFTESMGLLILGVLAGSVVFMAVDRAAVEPAGGKGA